MGGLSEFNNNIFAILIPAITLRPKYTTSKTLRLRFQLSTNKYGQCLSWPKLSWLQSGLRTKSKLQILITDPGLQIWDYGSGITDLGLRIRDYGSGITDQGLRFRITNLYYGSVLRIRITDNRPGKRNTDPDNFGYHRVKMDQGLLHFCTYNFSHDDRTNWFWTKCSLDEVQLPDQGHGVVY